MSNAVVAAVAPAGRAILRLAPARSPRAPARAPATRPRVARVVRAFAARARRGHVRRARRAVAM